jgi:hypothetical protein
MPGATAAHGRRAAHGPPYEKTGAHRTVGRGRRTVLGMGRMFPSGSAGTVERHLIE